jgi:type VI secretion system secreted protein VgrG
MPLIELTVGGDEPLRVLRFSVREALSSLFTVQVTASSPSAVLDFDAVVGKPAALRVSTDDGAGVLGARRWTGLCSRLRQLGSLTLRSGETGASHHEFTLVPALWALTRQTRYRSFQHLAGHDIVRRLLDEQRIDAVWHIDEHDHPRLATRVQYGETDFDFFSRLLEDAGIAYAFLDGEDASTLIFSDAIHLHAPRRPQPIPYLDSPSAASEREFLTHVVLERHPRATAVTIRDHDFLRPTWDLRAEATVRTEACSERCLYQPGAFLIEGGNPACLAHDDHHAARLAARTLEAERCGETTLSFRTNTLAVPPGSIITVDGHPRPELDPCVGLLITSLCIDGGPRGDWRIEATAVPSDTPYRPERRTPRPKAYGVQSALVVGPPGQEIHTDEHGRIQVQFPWARGGREEEQRSSWLRVAQGWAGAGHGLFALPRVGQEVLVAFLAGDPDQPVVVGRLSNPLNPPPVKLPDDKTQSVWRTSSSPGGDGFNEIRLEDSKGHELVSVRAERTMRTVVGRDDSLAVRRNREKSIGGDESARTEGRRLAYVGRDAHLTVEDELRERIGARHSVTVGGDRHEQVRGAVLMDAGGAIHLRAAGSLVLEASDVTLRGPGGFVRIDPSGVTLDGGAVKIQQGGAPGGAPAADPAPPRLPRGVALRAEPHRPPLLGFTARLPPMQAGGGGRGPLTPDETAVCGFICRCKDGPLKQRCVTQHIRALEEASGHTSTLKAEVPYDMSKRPPEPIMSRNDPRRPTRSWPAGSKIPDVVVVKDGTRPPTQDNIKEVIEVKFPPDELRENQRTSYEEIAGKARLTELGPDACGCRDRKRQAQEVTAGDVAEIALLTLLVLAAVLDDAAPGGQLDDAAIPPALARILDRLTPLLR